MVRLSGCRSFGHDTVSADHHLLLVLHLRLGSGSLRVLFVQNCIGRTCYCNVGLRRLLLGGVAQAAAAFEESGGGSLHRTAIAFLG